MSITTKNFDFKGTFSTNSATLVIHETARFFSGDFTVNHLNIDAQVIYMHDTHFVISEKASLVCHKIVFDNFNARASLDKFEITATVVEFKTTLPDKVVQALKTRIKPNHTKYPTSFMYRA